MQGRHGIWGDAPPDEGAQDAASRQRMRRAGALSVGTTAALAYIRHGQALRVMRTGGVYR